MLTLAIKYMVLAAWLALWLGGLVVGCSTLASLGPLPTAEAGVIGFMLGPAVLVFVVLFFTVPAFLGFINNVARWDWYAGCEIGD